MGNIHGKDMVAKYGLAKLLPFDYKQSCPACREPYVVKGWSGAVFA